VILASDTARILKATARLKIRCGTQSKVIQLQMLEVDLRTDKRPGGAESHQDFLAAENVSLRLLLAQAEINTRSLLAEAGIEPESARHPTSCRS
jgi:hypothetical protein